MPFLPDVLQVGAFPIEMRLLTGLLGVALAYALAGWLGRRLGSAAQDLLLNLMIGGILGAKLFYVLLNLRDYIANPIALLLFPYGPLALPVALAAGAGAAARGLWRRPDRLAVLDAAAIPLCLGLAVAVAGYKDPGSWAFTPLLAVAGLAALATTRTADRQAQAPGQLAARTVLLGACAAVLADLARPGAGMAGGISGVQLSAAVAGTGAWLWTRRQSK